MRLSICSHLLACSVLSFSATVANAMSLTEALDVAWSNDPVLLGSSERETALQHRAQFAQELPDPMVRVGVANLPLDTFDTNQEPFTQFQIGLTQSFPRGETRELGRQRLESLSEVQSWFRLSRKAEVELELTRLWLGLYVVQESTRLIESDRNLFEYLVDAAEASYVSAVGKSQQFDVVRAQLELTRLEERLITLKNREQMLRSALTEWLGAEAIKLEVVELPLISQRTGTEVVSHPSLKSIEQEIDSLSIAVELEEQKYKPAWSVSTSYGRRARDEFDQSRADFLSVAVNFDLPIFAAKKQDRLVAAARADKNSRRHEYDSRLRQMAAALAGSRQQEQQLVRQITLYEDRLLAQMSDQAEAALSAYTNDTGDFSEVIRARIAELEARLSFVHMNSEIQRVRSEIQYYLEGAD